MTRAERNRIRELAAANKGDQKVAAIKWLAENREDGDRLELEYKNNPDHYTGALVNILDEVNLLEQSDKEADAADAPARVLGDGEPAKATTKKATTK